MYELKYPHRNDQPQRRDIEASEADMRSLAYLGVLVVATFLSVITALIYALW